MASRMISVGETVQAHRVILVEFGSFGKRPSVEGRLTHWGRK